MSVAYKWNAAKWYEELASKATRKPVKRKDPQSYQRALVAFIQYDSRVFAEQWVMHGFP